MVCRGLRRAVPAAVTPLHLCLLRSQIQHPSPSTEPRWLHLWIQGWMGPQQLRAHEILGLWAEKEGPEPPEAEGADWVSPILCPPGSSSPCCTSCSQDTCAAGLGTAGWEPVQNQIRHVCCSLSSTIMLVCTLLMPGPC